MESYKQSKLAIILFTYELSKQLYRENIKIFAVSPGIVLTNLGRYHIQTYGYLSFFKLMLLYPFIKYVFKTPKEGAQTSIYCSVETDLISGKLYRNCKEIDISYNGAAEVDAKKLWILSDELTNMF